MDKGRKAFMVCIDTVPQDQKDHHATTYTYKPAGHEHVGQFTLRDEDIYNDPMPNITDVFDYHMGKIKEHLNSRDIIDIEPIEVRDVETKELPEAEHD